MRRPACETCHHEKYVELLKDKLAIHTQIQKCAILHDDGSPRQLSNKVKNHLTSAKATMLERIGNSPDLNPMGNLLEITKIKVIDQQPTSASALVDPIENVLIKEINIEHSQNLVSSNPRRIQAVTQNNGRHAIYYVEYFEYSM